MTRCHAASIATLASLAGSSALAQEAWLRLLVTEAAGLETVLPTTPPQRADALLQAKVWASPNGNYWSSMILTADIATNASTRSVISGTRTGVDFALATTQLMPGLAVAFEQSASGFDTEVLVNDAGDVSISGNLVPSTADEAIVLYRRSDQSFSFIAREGSPIPGFPGETFGGGLDQRQLLPDGRVVFRDGATSGSLASAVDEFIFVGGPANSGFGVVQQGGVLTPSGLVGPSGLLSDVELGYGRSADGTASLVRGIIARAAPNVVVLRNGVVVLEAGQPLPGAPTPTPPLSTAVAITDAGMNNAGDWWAVGRGASSGALWAVVNGSILFTSDGDFPGGDPGERFSQITGINVTNNGDVGFSGFTNLARPIAIVVRESGSVVRVFAGSTTVDLNNNNDPTDDSALFTSLFSSFLSDDGTFYFIVRGPGGDHIGYIPVSFATCDAIDFNGDGLFPDDADLVEFLTVLAGGACSTGSCNDIDFNNDGLFPDDSDLVAFLRVLAGGACGE